MSIRAGVAGHRLPFYDRTIVFTHCGRICLGKKKINFGTVFAGQAVGIKEAQDDVWLVSFMDHSRDKDAANRLKPRRALRLKNLCIEAET